ncbi:MAG TPA: thiamine-phosphate kinase [Spirochaetia bacterium]|nr:thiamine-phosphate kinase [Spirochaetia bacterium]
MEEQNGDREKRRPGLVAGRTVADTGERPLIDLITRRLTLSPEVVLGVGDDAAVLRSPPGLLLFTTDMLVEGIHFRVGYGTAEQLGYKALAVSVSDIAAMGGMPWAAVVSLALPGSMPAAFVTSLYQGLDRAARQFQVSVVGGDTVASPGPLVINVALTGKAVEGAVVTRQGARPGDLVFVTGSLGAAAAGLYVLENPGPWPAEASRFVQRRFLDPVPQLEAGNLLAAGGASALDDNSDGLAQEMHEICRASSVGCLIEVERLPVETPVREIAAVAGRSVWEWALHGGEDYGLVACVPPARAGLEEVCRSAGIALTAVGRIAAREEGLYVVWPDGRRAPLLPGGFEHFPPAGGCNGGTA